MNNHYEDGAINEHTWSVGPISTDVMTYVPPPSLPTITPLTPPPMSLRDWFAGQALVGLLAEGSVYGSNGEVAYICYKLADAMMKERNK